MPDEFMSGQLDAQRLAIIALAIQDKARFLPVFRELHQRLQGDLLAHPIEEARLDGIAAEVRAIEGLLTPTHP